MSSINYFSSHGDTVEVDAKVIIGADGARSAVRNEMMKRPRYQNETLLECLMFS